MSSSDEEDSRNQVSKGRNFRSIPPVYSPCFFISHGKKERTQTFCMLSDRSYHVRSVPELRGMRCEGSFYGWLILLSYDSNECHLFNPVTLNKIQLPTLPHETFDIGALTSPPTDPNCVVMFFSESKNLCIFCTIGGGNWYEKEVKSQNSDILLKNYRSAITRNGMFYLFAENGVAIVDIRDKFASIKIYGIKLPTWAIPGNGNYALYFVESCGEFFLVCKLCLGFSYIVWSFSVFKLDLSTMIWEKVEGIGNRVFLLGGHSDSVSLAPSEFGAKGNCLYFFMLPRPEICTFDMDTGRITVTQLCPAKFRQWEGPFWVVQNCNVHVKKEVAQVTEEIQVTSSNLLPELLETIFHFLHLDGIIRFRLAIKPFISLNLPVRLFPPQALSNSQYLPWLISLPSNKSNICHFYHPIYTDAYTMNLPQLTGAVVRHANFGWLLMSVGRKSLFFFNPYTTETIKLPEEPRCHGFVTISFSSPPTSPDYVVFGLKIFAENIYMMSVYSKIKDCWSQHFLEDQPCTFMPSRCNPVFRNGVFHCLSNDGKLGIFNPNASNEVDFWRVNTDLSVQDVRVSSSSSIRKESTRSFIMECDGEVFSVFVGFVGSPVRVYKLAESKKNKKWIKVESLGERVMFLSHTTSLLLPAVLKGTENRIYFPRFKGNFSLFYLLSSGNYHSFREQESRSDWINTTEHWNCCWFQNAIS